MDLHRIAIRALFVYVILFGLIRLSGKRTLAQATPFDFVLTLILGEMIDDALWSKVPLAKFVVGVGALTGTHFLMSWASWRSEWLDRLIDGRSTAVMEAGEPLPSGSRKERMSEKDLACEVRHAGIEREDWPEVRAAHAECSGEVSVLLHEQARPVQRKDAEAVRRARKTGERRPR